MKKSTFSLIFSLFVCYYHAQTATELFEKRDFQELVKLEKKADKLTPEELYMVGFAFFQLENDKKAIELYDKAIDQGLDDGYIYFYKGLSLYYMKEYDDALKQINISLERAPENQEYMNQKGQIYRMQGKNEKALTCFEAATKLPNTFGEPFFWVAYMHHLTEDFDKALALYYVAKDSVPVTNSYYLETLVSIGQLEYSYTKNYLKSAEAYTLAIAQNPDDYELYYKLMKSYNAAREFDKADSIFGLVKLAFEQGKLPQEDMEIKTIAIAQFEWNGQVAVIRRSLIDPKETLDISFKVFLLNKAGDKVERRFMVEKTIQIGENGAKHLLCEQDKATGDHITYPYGWSTDTIPIEDLEKAVKMVLDGKMTKGASSSLKKQ